MKNSDRPLKPVWADCGVKARLPERGKNYSVTLKSACSSTKTALKPLFWISQTTSPLNLGQLRTSSDVRVQQTIRARYQTEAPTLLK